VGRTFGGQGVVSANLHAIGQALLAYHAANGSFPPAALTNAAGTATVSWRVLLLPYLGRADLYNRFDLTKTWDDPANKALLREMPAVFRDASRPRNSTETGIAGAGGLKQVFRGTSATLGGGTTRSGVSDGVTMTVAAGPVGPDVHLPWTAPGDIDLAIHDVLGASTGFAGRGGSVTPLLFLDGIVRPIPNAVGPEAMDAWGTVAGGGCTP
jgi:Protein of unknown function (DUF1559)